MNKQFYVPKVKIFFDLPGLTRPKAGSTNDSAFRNGGLVIPLRDE